MIVEPGNEYVLNHCAKLLSRAESVPERDEDAVAGFRTRISEAWRFPIVGFIREQRPDDASPVNLVAFVYKMPPGDVRQIDVLGTFATLYEPIPLSPVMFDGGDTAASAFTGTVTIKRSSFCCAVRPS